MADVMREDDEELVIVEPGEEQDQADPATAEQDHEDRKSTRLNSSHSQQFRMPSSA